MIKRTPNLNGTNGNFYTKCNNDFLKDKNISYNAKGLLAFQLSNSDEWNFSAKGSAAFTPQKIDAVETARDELIEAGYLIQTSYLVGNYKYIIFDSLKTRKQYLKTNEVIVTNKDGSKCTFINSAKHKNDNMNKKNNVSEKKPVVVKKNTTPEKKNPMFSAFWGKYPRDNERMDMTVCRQALNIWNQKNLDKIALNILNDISSRPQLKKVKAVDYLQNENWNTGIFAVDKNDSDSVNMGGA